MPKISLSDASVRSLDIPSAGHLDYWDASFREGAFACRVAYSGTKTFIVKIGNARRSVGRYPLISLADARAEAKRMLAQKMLGKSRPQAIKYEVALAEFLDEKRSSRRKRTVDNLEERLIRHFSFKGQLHDISHHDVASRLAKLKTTSQYDHALSVARTFFTWAYNHRYIDDNPTRGLSLRGTVSRSRVLTDDELKRVWTAAEEVGGNFGTIVRLLILTGQRRGEISALDYAWMGTDTITLPASITKNKREHEFPLSPAARALLPPGGKGRVFPARGKRDQTFNGWSKGKSELDKKCGVSDWTLHDIRRTVATNLAALGIALPVIERLLNHVSGSFGGIVSVYQKHSFMPEMRAAVEKWETQLLELVAR